MHKTSIITVNFHQAELTCLFLDSVQAHHHPSEVEVIVVDNGSMIDQKERFEAHYPGLIYVRSEENLGFAGGNNLGIKEATGEYFLFLNNDTEIPEGLVQTLTSELDKHPDVGMLSPLILYYEDPTIIQYAGYSTIRYRTGRSETLEQFEANTGQFDQVTRPTGYCHGAAMICRKKDLVAAGLMETNYFLYYEELDWCEKFKRIGKRIAFTGKTYVLHKESMSVGKDSPLKIYFMTRNRWLFIRRNAPKIDQSIFSIYYLGVAIPFQLLKQLFKGRLDLVKATLNAVYWNLTQPIDSQYLGWRLPSKK
jgi:GT2 family glycosyltransferase